MQPQFHHASTLTPTTIPASADLLVIGVWAAEKSARAEGQDAVLSTEQQQALQPWDDALGGVLFSFLKAEGWRGDAGQTATLHTHNKISSARIAVVGLGSASSPTLNGMRKFGGKAVRLAQSVKAAHVVVVVPIISGDHVTAATQSFLEGAALANYRFDKYMTSSKAAQFDVKEVTLIQNNVAVEALSAITTAAQAVSTGVAWARNLVNEPPATLTPVRFAEEAQSVAQAYGLNIDVLNETRLEQERMGLLLAVAKAARPYTPPRVIKLTYTPESSKNADNATVPHIALVGKGLTFDSGGLDLKPADGMLGMKIDMGGAAAVLGAMAAIAQIKPNVRVTGYLGCVENGIGGNAYHPGDVLTSRKGLTVEINNTDAEGRLVLADCIDYAITTDKPDYLVDLATLTGACMIALGPTTSGLFSTDDAMANGLYEAGKRSGEDFWRMPLNEDLFGQLKSSIADMKNTGERYGGAITAALFLKQFVDGRVAWTHLDIAGPVSTEKDGEYNGKGGTGFGVRTLVDWVRSLA